MATTKANTVQTTDVETTREPELGISRSSVTTGASTGAGDGCREKLGSLVVEPKSTGLMESVGLIEPVGAAEASDTLVAGAGVVAPTELAPVGANVSFPTVGATVGAIVNEITGAVVDESTGAGVAGRTGAGVVARSGCGWSRRKIELNGRT